MNFARYRDPKGFEIRLVHGDVFDLSADAMIFGKTTSIRKRIEGTGAKFGPALYEWGERAYVFPKRDLLVARSRRLPWRQAFSVAYRTRHVPATSGHAEFLTMAIYQTVVFHACRDPEIGHVAIVPFGWREPQLLVYATLAALLLGQQQTFLSFPRCVTFCAHAGLDAFSTVLDNDTDFRKTILSWDSLLRNMPRRRRLFRRIRTGSVE